MAKYTAIPPTTSSVRRITRSRPEACSHSALEPAVNHTATPSTASATSSFTKNSPQPGWGWYTPRWRRPR